MTEWLRLIDCEYTTETDGYKQSTPVIHLFGRDPEWQRHHVRVDAFRPYFGVRQSEWMEVGEELSSDDRVLSVETTDHRGRDEQTIDGEPLVRVVCREPSDVADLREVVDDPFEADVVFPTRFLVDMADSQWIGLTDGSLDVDAPLNLDNIQLPSEDCEPPETVPPMRHCLYDIEVKQGGDGPPVVSKEGTERAENPITAITAYDTYTSEYHTWMLIHSEWDRETVEYVRAYDGLPSDCLHIYDNPSDVVAQFCQWVTERDFDSLCGWNAAGFDHPYLVNYGLSNGVGAVYDLAPVGRVYDMDGSGGWINQSLKGRQLLDLMTLYKKCKIHSLNSYRLSDIAQLEDVSVGKLSLEDEIDVPEDETAIDFAWRERPQTFLDYSLRDVKACVAINRETQNEVNII